MKTFILILIVLIFIILIVKAAKVGPRGKALRTETAQNDEISGTFTLILYGGNDPKQLAVFDREDDEYTFEVRDSGHNYTITKNVHAAQALEEAEKFIDSQRSRTSRILDDKAQVIGYEVRPLYDSSRYGASDILKVDYTLLDRKVTVAVDIKSSIKKTYERDRYGG